MTQDERSLGVGELCGNKWLLDYFRLCWLQCLLYMLSGNKHQQNMIASRTGNTSTASTDLPDGEGSSYTGLHPVVRGTAAPAMHGASYRRNYATVAQASSC